MEREEFLNLTQGRTAFVYAVNLEGIGFMRRLRHLGLDVGGFIDSRPFGHKHGLPVIHPDEFFARGDKNVFILIATKHVGIRKEAMDRCKAFGLERGAGFMMFTDLCDYMPTVEIAGLCNLRCRTCNMGLPGANQKGGLMSAETFAKVMAKLSTEIPFMNSIYLYLWGEPLLNPDLPEILRITARYGVASEISTNLINVTRLEDTIAAAPDVIVTPCAGIGENFALGRTGGTWDVYRDNLYRLRELLDRYGHETQVRITYHGYKNNMDEDYDVVESIARELDFQIYPILAQIFPERVLRKVLHDEPIPDVMLEASKNLCYSIEDQLAHAYSNRDKYCPVIRAFPTVRWDTSVAHCSNMMEPVVANSYLDMPFDEILRTRDGNGFCGRCMDAGLHRYFYVHTKFARDANGRRIMVRG
ncbi:MAG: hypothetical protein H6865_04240 [Rhodospirillales bacterium]|nr:hypothetical protein [Alphaproteobacteria bacterium]MCB9986827.1 hypothetical protein [Rhodospirillales bacterium]USO08409.1 MAG: hypothetical protein H6866_04140 [Rhodospirillales bacterium]